MPKLEPLFAYVCVFVHTLRMVLGCVFVCVCVVLGFELKAFTLSHSTSPIFVKGFFKIGSHKVFALAGFEP
jgi:hypothetical protein